MKSVSLCITVLSLVPLAQAQTPAVNPGGIVNAGDYSTGGVAPGSIVAIFGTNLGGQTSEAGSIPLPTALGDVKSVTFNGEAAPLYFVTATQVNAQVPWDASGTESIVVTTSGGSSAAQTVTIVPAMPGIFTTGANGLGQAIATDNADTALAAPTATIAGLSAHPIRIGDYLIVWCTGLGAVDATVANGNNTGGQIVNTLVKPTVLIGGVAATPIYSILSPEYVGEYQVGVQVPVGTPTGSAVSLQIQLNGVSTSTAVTLTVDPANVSALSASCTLTSTSCTAIDLSTDPASATAFAGYADPTIRQDPQTGTLWMAYSWLHTIAGSAGGVQAIDTHVSYSTDGGATWIYKGPLFTSQQVTNPVTGDTDDTANEVMNLFPQVVNGVTYWYGIHSVYNLPATGGGTSETESYSRRWEIAMAPGDGDTGPMGLATATPQYLGQTVDNELQSFPVSVNLSSLNAELSSCAEFFEPSLIIEDNILYLFLSCQSTAGAAGTFYAVFQTPNPQANAPNWQWTYIPEGDTKFADSSDAASVGAYLGTGATYITQMDVAPGKQPGTLMAVMTAAYNTASGKVSLGCVAAELASVNPPKFIYNSQSAVQVDAFLTSSDSTSTGPGSCTYSPYSSTGIIMAHRQDSMAAQNGGFYSFLMQSMLLP